MAATVVIVADNEFIASRLLANVSVLQQHQFLRTTLAEINALRETCGSCSGKKTKAEEDIRAKWQAIRRYLVGLSEPQRNEMKQLAKVKPNQRVRISYLVGSGSNTSMQSKDF